ncbi:MAG: hypothetical protein AB1428_10075 [Bacteroidota bacterium]
MKGWRGISAVALLAAYVFTGLLAETLHREAITVRLTDDPAVSTHRCGEREMHLPLDGMHRCAICAQSSTRFCTPPQAQGTVSAPLVVVATLPAEPSVLRSAAHPYVDSRGPPLS